jgi:hypothetical protein
LNKIVIIEFTKTLYTKEVDEENKEGYFIIFKRLINSMVAIVKEINPNYPYPKFDLDNCKGLFTSAFLKEHLSITDCTDTITPTDFSWILLTP